MSSEVTSDNTAGVPRSRVNLSRLRFGVSSSEGTNKRTSQVTVSRIDPWSSARTAFIVSMAVSLTLLVVITVVWFFLSVTGVIDAIQGSFGNILGTGIKGGVSLLEFVRVLGLGLIVCAVQIVTTSVSAALFAMMYNITVGYTGGIKVDLESSRN